VMRVNPPSVLFFRRDNVNRLEKIHHGARTDRQSCVTLLHPVEKTVSGGAIDAQTFGRFNGAGFVQHYLVGKEIVACRNLEKASERNAAAAELKRTAN
jgi:hypothetical protein